MIVLALFFIGYFGITFQTQIMSYLVVLVLGILSFFLVLTIRKEGDMPTIFVLIGVSTLIWSALIPTNFPISEEALDPTAFWWSPASEKVTILTEMRDWTKYFGLTTGIFCIGGGLALAYRPSLLYVKNRPHSRYPYPIWESKKQQVSKFSPSLMPVRTLLTTKEKLIAWRYKFFLVVIGNKPYLVSANEYVPEGTVILRTKSGNALRGI